jgi:putative transposase
MTREDQNETGRRDVARNVSLSTSKTRDNGKNPDERSEHDVPVVTLYQNKYRVESTRLRTWDYRARGWYFVTICTQNRAHIFGEVVAREMLLSQAGLIADSELRTLHSHYENVAVEEQVVMPNHVHAIILIDGEHCFSPSDSMSLPLSAESAPTSTSPRPGSLSAIMRSYKAGVTRKCREMGLNQEIWQSRFHDRLLRGDQVIAAVREYIRNNPGNWLMDRDNHS